MSRDSSCYTSSSTTCSAACAQLSLYLSEYDSTEYTPQRNSEQGSVLILLAVLAATLFSFIAIGIDTGLLSITRRDHSNLAPMAASAALKTFTSTSGSFDERFNAARIRAEEIAQSAVDSATTTYFYKNHGYEVELGSPTNPGSTGYIQAGMWHFAPLFSPPYFDPDTGECAKRNDEQCPCNDQGGWNTPCFEKLDSVSANPTPPEDPNAPFIEPQVTAIHIQLRSPEESPFRALFASAFGGKSEFHVQSSAIVAARPIRMIVLFDLSRSTHSETHIPYEALNDEGLKDNPNYNASEYAYRISNKACIEDEPPPSTGAVDMAYVNSELTCKPSGGACPGTLIPQTSQQPALGPSDCTLQGGVAFNAIADAYDAVWNSCNAVTPPGKVRNIAYPTFHSKADYRCVTINPVIDETPEGDAHYLVDAFRGTVKGGAFEVRGAEPLESMLSAIRQSMKRFEEREIYGDRLSVIGIDQEANIEQRVFPLTEPSTDVTLYQTMQQVFAEDADFTLRHQQHFWFPREDAMLNLPKALGEAYEQLISGPEFHYSDNHIVLISDGVSECYFDDVKGEQVCDKTQEAIEKSLADSLDLIEEHFEESSIKFSVLLVGDAVQPHSLARKSLADAETERCMTEDESRNSDDGTGQRLPWVDPIENSSSYRDTIAGGGFDDETGRMEYQDEIRYHAPNALYSAVVQTGGVWGAIRPACQPEAAQLSGGNCQDGALENFLDQRCATLDDPGELLSSITGTKPIVDASGRLVCDARCRSRDEQFEDYMDQVFESFPYVAVQNNIQVN